MCSLLGHDMLLWCRNVERAEREIVFFRSCSVSASRLGVESESEEVEKEIVHVRARLCTE